MQLLLLGGVAVGFLLAVLSPRSLDTPSFQKMAATMTWCIVLFVPVLLLLIRLTPR